MCNRCPDDRWVPTDHTTTTVTSAAAWQRAYALPAEDDRPSARELKEDER